MIVGVLGQFVGEAQLVEGRRFGWNRAIDRVEATLLAIDVGAETTDARNVVTKIEFADVAQLVSLALGQARTHQALDIGSIHRR